MGRTITDLCIIYNQAMQICWLERRETFVLAPLSATGSEAEAISHLEIKAYPSRQPECRNLSTGFPCLQLVYFFP